MEMAFGIFALVADWISGLDWKFILFWGGVIGAFAFIRKLNEKREAGLAKEFERNEKFAATAPETNQLKWHVRHMREDLSLLCFLVALLLGAQIILVAIELFRK
jgi:hypothetical protein